jgi:ATP-binding cassette subfamily B (MDR/TAP) protein 1
MLMMWIIFLFYSYSFYWGGRLRYDEVKNGDREYTGGAILAIMFSVVFGALQVGGMMPHLKAVTDSKIAGKLAFDVIDHVPKVPVNAPESEQVQRNTIQGLISFKNVSFRYPTRQELQVLNNFSFTFEAGKTTALVGPSGSGKSTVIQLIERFYDPDSGSVSLDGKDFKTLNLRSMR